MSAQIRIMPQEEADAGFSLLKDIVEMVKNPKAIDAAYEARRKAAEMTQDEIAKAEEARALIAKGDALKADLKKQSDDLELAKTNHQNAVELHNKRVQSENNRLAEWESRLNGIAAKHEETDISHAKIKGELDTRAKEIEDHHAGWEASYKERVNAIATTESAQKEAWAKIADEKKKLQDKAARLAAEANS